MIGPKTKGDTLIEDNFADIRRHLNFLNRDDVKQPPKIEYDASSPLHEAVQDFKDSLDELKAFDTKKPELQSIAESLDTSMRIEFDSWSTRATLFDKKDWEKKISQFKEKVTDLLPESKADAPDVAAAKTKERNALVAALDNIQKKALSDQTESLKKKLSEDHHTAYCLFMAQKLSVGGQMWREINEIALPPSDPDYAAASLKIYGTPLKDGIYTRDDLNINIKYQKSNPDDGSGSLTIITKSGNSRPTKQDFEKAIDFIATRCGAEGFTIEFPNVSHGQLESDGILNQTREMIEIAARKGLKVDLGPNVEAAIRVHGAGDIYKLIADNNNKIDKEKGKVEDHVIDKVKLKAIEDQTKKLADNKMDKTEFKGNARTFLGDPTGAFATQGEKDAAKDVLDLVTTRVKSLEEASKLLDTELQSLKHDFREDQNNPNLQGRYEQLQKLHEEYKTERDALDNRVVVLSTLEATAAIGAVGSTFNAKSLGNKLTNDVSNKPELDNTFAEFSDAMKAEMAKPLRPGR